MPNSVRIGVGVTGAKGAASEMDTLRDKFAKMQAQGAKGFAIGVGAAAGMAALNGMGRAVGAVTDLIGDATTAFIEDARSQQLLTTAIRANVDGWDENTDAIEGVLEARMKLGFSDDEQRESLAGLVGAYGDVAKALEVERTAMDLARYSGVSLATASDMLIKVHAGSYRALKTLGISLDGVTDETSALTAIQRIAGGQAEDYAATLEGRLAVSAVRSAEAIEHLGEGTAELSADFEQAKAGAIEDFAGGLDFLADSLNRSSQSQERQLELQAEEIAMSPFLKQAEKDASIAKLQLAMDTLQATKALGKYADVSLEARDAAAAATGPTSDLTGELDDLEDQAEDTERAIDDLADTIEEELFGDAINAGNLASLRKTHDELLKDRDAAKEGGRQYKILTGEIAENEKAIFDLQLQMKEKEGPRAVIAWLEKQKDLFGDASGAIQRLIDKYRTLDQVQGRVGTIVNEGGDRLNSSGGGKRRASGGPVTKGQVYTVGEEGPETFVAPANGTIIPHGTGLGGSAMGGSAPAVIAVPMMWTPAVQQQFIRDAGPAIKDYLRRAGLV